MSYWVSLNDADGNIFDVELFQEGGTFALSGSTDATLNVTYNYSEVFVLLGWGLRDLHACKASDTLPKLTELCDKLPNKPYGPDYWAPTPGNAGVVVHRLKKWAEQHPDGVWRVS